MVKKTQCTGHNIVCDMHLSRRPSRSHFTVHLKCFSDLIVLMRVIFEKRMMNVSASMSVSHAGTWLDTGK